MAIELTRSVLIVESKGGIRLLDVRKFLVAIEDAYNRILLLLTYLGSKGSPGSLFTVSWERLGLVLPPPREPMHFTKSSVASLVGRSRSLILKSVRLESPGNWKLLGISDSLEVLRKYLNDRHERREKTANTGRLPRKKEVALRMNYCVQRC